jgi:hypothetical protein
MRARAQEAERAVEAARAEGAERELEGLRALVDAREEVGPALWDALQMLGALTDEASDAAEEGAGEMERG